MAASSRPFLGLTSGYVRRGAGLFPIQGEKAPWLVRQNYILDLFSLHFGRVDDGTLAFARSGTKMASDSR